MAFSVGGVPVSGCIPGHIILAYTQTTFLIQHRLIFFVIFVVFIGVIFFVVFFVIIIVIIIHLCCVFSLVDVEDILYFPLPDKFNYSFSQKGECENHYTRSRELEIFWESLFSDRIPPPVMQSHLLSFVNLFGTKYWFDSLCFASEREREREIYSKS